MPVSREKLILWSICALTQRSEAAEDPPMRPDFAIKSVLAFLHAMGAARAHVNGYWQEMIRQHPASYPAGTPKYLRGTEMRTQIECIMRDLGVVDDPVFRHDITVALHGPAPHPWQPHERLIAELREQRRELAERRQQRAAE